MKLEVLHEWDLGKFLRASALTAAIGATTPGLGFAASKKLASNERAAPLPTLAGTTKAAPEAQGTQKKAAFKSWRDLKKFAEDKGFVVTSTTGGQHNKGSAHGRGLAVDVRTRDHTKAQVDAFISQARTAGIWVKDERTRPAGQAVWSGPHIHLEIR